MIIKLSSFQQKFQYLNNINFDKYVSILVFFFNLEAIEYIVFGVFLKVKVS